MTIPGLAAWFKFGAGITSSGSSVSQWSDSSGNGRNLLQATGSAQPTLQSDNTILFNGTAQFLKTNAFTLNQPETVYLLFKQVSWTGSRYIFDGNGVDGGSLNQNGASPNVRMYAGNVDANFTQLVGLTVGAYGTIACVYNGASSVAQVGAQAAISGNAGTNNLGGFTLGAAGNSTLFSNIQVKEALIYSAAHNQATRTQLIAYLNGI